MISKLKIPGRCVLPGLALMLLLGSVWTDGACTQSLPDGGDRESDGQRAAINRVLAADDIFGRERNQDCRTVSLDSTIVKYVNAMHTINFEGCPDSFTSAFAEHISAWQSSLPFFSKHAQLRGEMHALFEEIRSLNEQSKIDLESIEKEIWGSWAKVETASELDNSDPEAKH